jgi:hypothetical protein
VVLLSVFRVRFSAKAPDTAQSTEQLMIDTFPMAA